MRMGGVEVGNRWVKVVCVKYVIKNEYSLRWAIVRMSGVKMGSW